MGPRILAGAAILLLGRRLFWLFVGVVGFVFGFDFAAHTFQQAPYELHLVLALLAGILGAVLAYFLQQVMVGVAGFVVGAQLAVLLFNAINPITSRDLWTITFIAGGIIGAALLLAVFDSALILLSSLLGASFIVEAIELRPYAKLGVFLALLLVGVVAQTNMPRPRPRRRR